MGEIGGPVQRIDVPAVRAFLPGYGRFFGNDLVCGKMHAQDVSNQRVGGFIDVGDQIDDVGFDFNGFRFEPIVPEQSPSLMGSLLSDS